MERRNKVLYPGALQYVGEADGCGYIMGFLSVLWVGNIQGEGPQETMG